MAGKSHPPSFNNFRGNRTSLSQHLNISHWKDYNRQCLSWSHFWGQKTVSTWVVYPPSQGDVDESPHTWKPHHDYTVGRNPRRLGGWGSGGGGGKKLEQQNQNCYNPSDHAWEFQILERFNFPYHCCLAWTISMPQLEMAPSVWFRTMNTYVCLQLQSSYGDFPPAISSHLYLYSFHGLPSTPT